MMMRVDHAHGRAAPSARDLIAGPLRLALLDECTHADAEIVAAVAGAHEIIAVRQPGMQEAADRLLAHAHGDRRMLRQAVGQLGDAPVEVRRRHDLAEEAAGQRLLGGQILRQQQHALGARGPERGNQARAVGDRQAIAERAGDRNAEARAGRGDAQVAGRRDREPAADGKTLDHRQRRHRQRLDGRDGALHLLLVGDAVLAAAERLELGDVGAGDEGLAAGAAKDRDAHACSSRMRAQASPSCSYIRQVMALRAAGRSKITVATARRGR